MKNYIKMVLFLVVLSVISAVLLTAFSIGIKNRIEKNKKKERLVHILKSMQLLPQEVVDAIKSDMENFEKTDDYKNASNHDFAEKAYRCVRAEFHLKQLSAEKLGTMFKNVRVMEIVKKDPAKLTFYTGEEFLDPANAKNIDYIHKVYVFKGKNKGGYVYCVEIAGAGFWDKVAGYLTLKEGLHFVGGLSFYDHKETPGLGKRIEEGWFQAQFTFWNKQIFPAEGEVRCPRIRVTPRQGAYEGDAEGKPQNEVEAITGASETSRALDRFATQNLRDFFDLLTEARSHDQKKFDGFFDLEKQVEVSGKKVSASVKTLLDYAEYKKEQQKLQK